MLNLEIETEKTYTALAAHLPESIRPLLKTELVRIINVAQTVQSCAEHKRRLEESRYNGWINRETWLVGLWWSECPIEEIEAETKEEAISTLAEQLEAYFEEVEPMAATGLLADLMNGATSRIDWREIAEHWIDDIAVTLTEEEEA